MVHQMCEVAQRAVKRVGERLKSAQVSGQDLKVRHKGRIDLVTELDLWSERELTAEVRRAFPDHLVVGEESAEELRRARGLDLEQICRSGVSWIIDPVDGTTNFANGIPHFAVSIGILIDGKRAAGVVFDPSRNETFHAVKGSGAFLNGRPIAVSKKNELINAVVATGFPYDRATRWDSCRRAYEAFLLASRDLRRFGSASLDLCWCACGRFDGYFEHNLQPWDVAGGCLIMEEGGGCGVKFGEDLGSELSIFAGSFIFAGPELLPGMIALAKSTIAGAECDGTI